MKDRPPVTATPDDDEIDLRQLLGTLWKGKFWIAVGTALGVAGAAFVFANTPPTFQADALLQLEENSNALSLPSSLSDALDSGDPRSVTEIEILRSRLVLGQAVASVNLDWVVEQDRAPLIGNMVARYSLPLIDALLPDRFARPGESISLTQLVVPPEWVGALISVTLGEEGQFRLTTPDAREIEGLVGQPVSLPDVGFALTLDTIRAPAGRHYSIRQISEISAIRALRGRLTASERGRSSGILEARLTGGNARDNVRALNAVMEAYQRQNVTRSAAQADGSLQFIREQLPQAEEALRTAEAALNAFRQQRVSVDLSMETQALLSTVTSVEAELATLRQREDEIAQRYTPSHPTHRLLLEERERLEMRLTQLREQVGTLPETQRQIVNLSRDVELAQRLYTELLTRAQQVEVLRASTIGNVRIIDPAATSGLAIAPRKTIMLAIGLLLGGFAGIGVIMVRNSLRKGVQDPADIEKLGIPVFATINYSRNADTEGRRKGQMPILALDKPDDLAVEAFRSLRTSLHFGMLDAASPTLTITSAHPGAGKSFVSTNLAVVAAEAGQQVCLIDADLRRGQLRRYFDLPRNQPGLAEVLSGDLTLDEVLLPGPVGGLYVLGTGRYPPNPSELLMRAQLRELLALCGQKFDLTIMDTPPALAVTDPVIIAQETGATIFVARHDLTVPGEIEATIKTFANANLRLNGTVLNGFDPRKSKGGYGYKYGYGYGYRYEYKRDKS